MERSRELGAKERKGGDHVQSEMCKDAEGENIGKLLNCPFKVINRLTPLK